MTNIILGVVVIMIWALFVRGILKGLDDSGNDILPLRAVTKKIPFNDYEQKKDTARILLNYRDPFHAGTTPSLKDTMMRQVKHREIALPAIPKPVEDLSFIKYSGFIYNPATKTTISIISVNGKNAMVADGEVTDGIKIIKNMKDSIKISYRNKIRFISRT